MKRDPRPPLDDRAVDAWIDTFRDVFLRSDSGVRVLSYLAARWHFFDRTLDTEERRVQRQCFVDLMIHCGVFEQDTGDQVMSALLRQPPVALGSVARALHWLDSWRRIRTKRLDLPQPKAKEERSKS
jgi:hypothetical protein